jgi:NitT/TauT family transport system substrate-binding protein
MGRRSVLKLGAAAALVAAVPARATASTPVVATFGFMDLTYLPNIVALEKGFAAANGLELTLRITEGGPQSRTMVAAGEAHFAHGDSTLPLQLIGKGVPAKILMSTESQAPYANLIVRQDLFDAGVTSVEKLATWTRPDGAKPIVGVSTIGAGTWIWGTYLFEKIGKGAAVNFIAGGSSFALLAALSSGRFDATMGGPDMMFQAAAEKWGRVAFDATDTERWNSLVGGPIPASSVYTLQSTIDSRPEMVASYIKSLRQSLDWIKVAPNADVVAVVRAKYLPNSDVAAINYGLNFHRKTMNFAGDVDPIQFTRGSSVWFRHSTGLSSVAYSDAVEPRFLIQAAQ